MRDVAGDLLEGAVADDVVGADAEDLPLNLSREMLQNNPQLAQIRKAVASRVITELETLGEKDQETFAKISANVELPTSPSRATTSPRALPSAASASPYALRVATSSPRS